MHLQLYCPQFDTGRTPEFLLLVTDFKSDISFGILIKKYMGHAFWIFFVKPQNGLLWPNFCVLKKVFSRGFHIGTVSALELKTIILLGQTVVRTLRA